MANDEAISNCVMRLLTCTATNAVRRKCRRAKALLAMTIIIYPRFLTISVTKSDAVVMAACADCEPASAFWISTPMAVVTAL